MLCNNASTSNSGSRRRRLISNLEDYLRVSFQNSRKFKRIEKKKKTTTMSDSSSTALPRNQDFRQSSGGWISDDGRLSCGFSTCKGRRATMEDFFDVKFVEVGAQAVYLFGIFDGHGGSLAAQYLKEHLFENLMKHPEFMTNTKFAISDTFTKTDEGFLTDKTSTQRDDGSTASTAVLVGNNLYLANVGDSRAIISKAGQAIQLTDDHKPNRTDERRRIENAGGVVMWAGTWRVGGVLAMSRAFGNRLLKQFVVAEPEIQEQEVDEQLEYLVLASDGLWDVVKNEEAVTIVTSQNEPEAAAQKLIETALTRGSADNITCIVVRFHHNKDNSATAVPSPSPGTSTDIPSSETSGQGPPPSLTDAGSDDAEGQPPSSPTDSYPSFADDNSGSSLAADTVGSSSTNNADVSSSATALVSAPGSVSVNSPPLAPAENFVPE